MTSVSNAALQRIAHVNWLRDEAAHIRRLAAGAIPFAVAQDLDQLAAEYEREAASMEGGVRNGKSCHAVDSAAETR